MKKTKSISDICGPLKAGHKSDAMKSANAGRALPNIYACFAVAAVLRYALLVSKYAGLIQQRVEISTPLNSWKRGGYNDGPSIHSETHR